MFTRQALPPSITRLGLFLFALSIPVSHVPAQIGIGLAVLGWIADGLINRRWRFAWHPFLALLAAYLGWNLLASLLSPRPGLSLGMVARHEWHFLIMLMMLWTVDDVGLLRRIVYAYFAISALAMAYALWQTVGGIELFRAEPLRSIGGYYRAVGFYDFYLMFAAYAMTVFFLALCFAIERRDTRGWSILLAAGTFLAIIGSFARSIWLSLAFGIPALGLVRAKRSGLILCSALLALGIAAVALVPPVRHRAASIFDLGQNETRLNLWKTSLRIAQARPITGVGEGNFEIFFPRYKVAGFYDTTVHPHSDYLSVLVAAGVPGLLAFVGMWWYALRTGLGTWRRAQSPDIKAMALGSTFGLLGFVIGAAFQNYYGTFTNCFDWWFVVGVLLSSHRLAHGETTGV